MNSQFQSYFPTIRERCIEFLQQSPAQRLQILQDMGIGRYDFLTQIPLTENNIICLIGYFQDTRRLKFPRLKNADLSGLILDDVNWIRGDLTGAKLRGTRLRNADLIFANFTDADLTEADLSEATLNETIWRHAKVARCLFGSGLGLTQQQRKILSQNGGIFKPKFLGS